MYSACLVLSASYILVSLAQDFSVCHAATWLAMVGFIFFLRTRRLNKYLIWALFAVGIAYATGGVQAIKPAAFFALPRNDILWQTAGRV